MNNFSEIAQSLILLNIKNQSQEVVKKIRLHTETNYPMMQCKKALFEFEGDYEKAKLKLYNMPTYGMLIDYNHKVNK